MKHVEIYTDGACSGNPGKGGWGAVLLYKGHEKRISGYSEHSTNNIMELTAAIKALEALKSPCFVNLYSDSAYLVNGFNLGWVENWKKRGWKKSSKKEVKNKELWMRLDELGKIHKVNYIKVKGHADNEYNNLCDKLATDIIKEHS